MRKVIAGAFVSLDGVMQAPGGPEEDPSGGFKHGGWTAPYWEDAIGQRLGETFSGPFDLLLGRRTYDIFAAYWPYFKTDPTKSTLDTVSAQVAKTFNDCTKYVATHHPHTLSWQNSQSLGENPTLSVRDLKKQDGRILLIQGSSQLIQQLLAENLIDEFRLVIYPLLLGRGKRLFGSGTIPAAFKVTKSTVTPGGVVMATYERAGDVKTGSFAHETPSEAEAARRRGLRD